MITRRYVLFGRVQGVGFRYFTERIALRLEVSGWVRNRPDGTVEVVAQAQEGILQAFREHLQQGPPWARVHRIEESEADQGDFTSFTIER